MDLLLSYLVLHNLDGVPPHCGCEFSERPVRNEKQRWFKKIYEMNNANKYLHINAPENRGPLKIWFSSMRNHA